LGEANLDELNIQLADHWPIHYDGKYVYVSKLGQEIELHRYVMEKILGRKLLPTEIIHHRDENPRNNDPDNLELHTRATHAAQHSRGRTATNETRKKQRQSHLGEVVLESTREKMKQSATGRTHSEVTKEKLRQLALERERRKRNGKSNS